MSLKMTFPKKMTRATFPTLNKMRKRDQTNNRALKRDSNQTTTCKTIQTNNITH